MRAIWTADEFVDCCNLLSLSLVEFSLFENSIVISNPGTTELSVGIFNDAAVCMAVVDPFQSLSIDMNLFFSRAVRVPDPCNVPPSFFIVPHDIHVCSVYVELFRKREAGSYERFQDVWLPAGFYMSLQEVAAAMTAGATMKGERNGFVYKFEVSAKRPVLRLMAHHKQPLGSWLKVYPADGSKVLGLAREGSMQLGNRKFIDFDMAPLSYVLA